MNVTVPFQTLSPHIYQLASAAYTDLVRGQGHIDQSIVVSGESGAGKTVSAKHLLRYLTIISSTSATTGVLCPFLSISGVYIVGQ